MTSTLRSVCVFCGSRAGGNANYALAAHDVGVLIAEMYGDWFMVRATWV